MVGLLVLASLAMITVYFRESPNGGLHDFQSAASSVLRPFEIAANRVVRPFEDAWNWTADVFHAKSENENLRQQVKDLRQQAIQRSQALEERDALRRLLRIKRAPAYEDFANTAVTAEVISNPVSQFDQTMVVAAGRTSGIRVYDAVITERGLVVRDADADDRRKVLVRLTAAGLALVDEVAAAHMEVEREILGDLSPTQRADLADLLRVPLLTLGDDAAAF